MTRQKKPRAEGDLLGVNMTIVVSTSALDHRSTMIKPYVIDRSAANPSGSGIGDVG